MMNKHIAAVLAATGLLAPSAGSAQEGGASGPPKVHLCRAWAKMNVQVFETQQDRWKAYYTASYEKLKAANVSEADIKALDEKAGAVISDVGRDQIALYLDMLNYDLKDQAAKIRKDNFGFLDDGCK